MKISVIIPTYKPKDYVWECLESVANQTLDHADFEVILVLNGCNEPYLSEIKGRISRYDINIRIFQTDIAGVSNARNIGIDKSEGEYICFIDDDDYVSKSYLEELLSLSKNDCIVASNVKYFGTTDKSKTHYVERAYMRYKIENSDSLFHSRSFLSSSCCKIIPREIIGSSRFNTKLRRGEDSMFMFGISKNIRSIYISGKDCIYYVRQRQDSASRKKIGYAQHLRECFLLIFNYTKLFIKTPLSYNFSLYASRIFATLIKMSQR